MCVCVSLRLSSTFGTTEIRYCVCVCLKVSASINVFHFFFVFFFTTDNGLYLVCLFFIGRFRVFFACLFLLVLHYLTFL